MSDHINQFEEADREIIFLKEKIAMSIQEKQTKDAIVKSLTCENLRLTNMVEILESKERMLDVFKGEIQFLE